MRPATQNFADFMGQAAGGRCGAAPAPQHAVRCIIYSTLPGCAWPAAPQESESSGVSNARAALRPDIRCFFLRFSTSPLTNVALQPLCRDRASMVPGVARG